MNCQIVVAIFYLLYNVKGDTNYRLGVPLVPSAYSIAITPYFNTENDKQFTFDGEVSIAFTTEAATNQIKIHSEDLNFDASNITVINGGANIALNETNSLEFDKNFTFVYINLATELQVGVEYVLKIVYTGPIREDLTGFYRNYYIENGIKKWLGATQMEPTHARKVFPCFDEPHLKATFTLTIDRPENYKPSLANTKLQFTVPLSNGYVREIFYPTPKMSTYLVAFLVSEFDAAETYTNGTKEFGVYTRPDSTSQAKYAFDIGLKVVNALSDYLGIDYFSTDPNLKLDHVALPDFQAGAMENWGLVKYRESLLLYVPEESTPYYKYRVAQIVAHETTHMWFGNLVTCHWWSDTWLNEGFANYFQDYITALIEPEVASNNMLVTGSVYVAYDADSSPASVPITNNNVNSPAEISGHFGTITYQKAGSVIRMIHHLIGDEAFRDGLNLYLNTMSFQPSYPDKLYAALDQSVAMHNALVLYDEATVADVMSSWITQAGHPVLHVSVNYEDGTVSLHQKRYYMDSSHTSNETYAIPITYTTKETANFNNTKPQFIMTNITHVFDVSNLTQDSWIIFNVQETGFYRVNYDDESWQIISNALKSSERENIHHLNRAKIINDLFAFLYADEVQFDRLTDVLDFLADESDYSVWYAAIRGLNKLWHVYLGNEALEDIRAYGLKILEHGVTKLGYEVKSTDDFETLRNRMQVLEFACKLGHQGCIDNAVELFKTFKENGTAIIPSLRPMAYCIGLRYGAADDYEFLWQRMANTNVANEARIIGDALGCTSDEAMLNRYLVSMLEENSPIRTQDITVPLTSVLADYSHLHVVMDTLKTNYTLWSTIYPSMDTVLSTIASVLHTEEDFNEFSEWLASCTECSDQTKASANAALNQSRATTAWAENHKNDIVKNIRNSSPITAPTAVIIFMTVLSAIFARFEI